MPDRSDHRALHLVANAVITWNTVDIARALGQHSRAAAPMADELARLTPTLYAHINPHGTYAFDASAAPAEGLRPLREPVGNLIAA